jgi:hypothetical protein
LNIHDAYAPVFIEAAAQSCAETNGYTQANTARKKWTNIGITKIGKEIIIF